ncbi:MAG: hypothetical protein ACLVKO_09050 [Dysgonomonas sp.]
MELTFNFSYIIWGTVILAFICFGLNAAFSMKGRKGNAKFFLVLGVCFVALLVLALLFVAISPYLRRMA